ncbi:hypothetical protein F2P56_012438, partial [Juglans regia]
IGALQCRLAGKVALITGGASGIGESTARLFAEHGAKVIISDVQDELGFSVSQDKSINGAISYVHCDVTSECDVQNAVNTAVSKHGKLDIMFNTAGCTGQNKASILDHEQKDYKTVFDVNVLGSFLGAKHVAKVMIPVKRGTILFTASCVTESHGLASHSYTASKHANPAILNLSAIVDLTILYKPVRYHWSRKPEMENLTPSLDGASTTYFILFININNGSINIINFI